MYTVILREKPVGMERAFYLLTELVNLDALKNREDDKPQKRKGLWWFRLSPMENCSMEQSSVGKWLPNGRNGVNLHTCFRCFPFPSRALKNMERYERNWERRAK